MQDNLSKSLLRTRIEGLRSQMNAEQHREASRLASERVIRFLNERWPFASGKRPALMTFMPFRSEIDVTPIAEWAWSRGVRVLVPRVIRKEKRMEFCEVAAWSQLASGVYGIREPAAGAPVWNIAERIDIALIPGVAFDRSGGRLGYGGGYYDRWFAEVREKQGAGALPYLLAPAFELQVVEQVPCEAHDVKMDAVITEKGLYLS